MPSKKKYSKKGHLAEKQGDVNSGICSLPLTHQGTQSKSPSFSVTQILLCKIRPREKWAQRFYSALLVPAGLCLLGWAAQESAVQQKVCRETSVLINQCLITFWYLEGQSSIIMARTMTIVFLVKRKLEIGSGYNHHFGHHSSGITLNGVSGLECNSQENVILQFLLWANKIPAISLISQHGSAPSFWGPL